MSRSFGSSRDFAIRRFMFLFTSLHASNRTGTCKYRTSNNFVMASARIIHQRIYNFFLCHLCSCRCSCRSFAINRHHYCDHHLEDEGRVSHLLLFSILHIRPDIKTPVHETSTTPDIIIQHTKKYNTYNLKQPLEIFIYSFTKYDTHNLKPPLKIFTNKLQVLLISNKYWWHKPKQQ